MPLGCHSQVEGVQGAVDEAIDREVVDAQLVHIGDVVHQRDTCQAPRLAKSEEPCGGRKVHNLQVVSRFKRASDNQTITRFEAESLTFARRDNSTPWPGMQKPQ